MEIIYIVVFLLIFLAGSRVGLPDYIELSYLPYATISLVSYINKTIMIGKKSLILLIQLFSPCERFLPSTFDLPHRVVVTRHNLLCFMHVVWS